MPVDLWRLTPFSREFGADRGTPMDRYYIERFLADHAADIHGRVLEMGDNIYTSKYGGRNVTRSDVLFQREGKPGVTIVDDIQTGHNLPSDAFDCIVFTQTFQLLWDSRGAIRTIHRILKPGGVALATFPGNSQLAQDDKEGWYDYWRMTRRGAARLWSETFGAGNVTATSHGNPLVICGFMMGLTVREFSQRELDHRDPVYELSLTLRAVKPGGAARPARTMPVLIGGPPIGAPERPPALSLWLRVLRSPGADLRLAPAAIEALRARAGIVEVLTRRDLAINVLRAPAGGGKSAILDDAPEPGGGALAVIGTKPALAALDRAKAPWTKAAAPGGASLAAFRVSHGDATDGFATAKHVAQARIQIAYTAQPAQPAAAHARKITSAGREDRLLVVGPTTNPHLLGADIARALGIAVERVRVIAQNSGCEFADDALALTAIAAWRSGKPVRLAPEPAPSAASATAAGRIAADEWGYTSSVAAEIEVAGALRHAPELARRAALHAGGPYYIWNVASEARVSAAERDARGALPAIAVAAGAVLHEALIDELARKRRQDPFAFRWTNALRRGYPTIADQWLTTAAGLRPCLDALRPIWTAGDAAKRRGRGIACGWYGLGASFENATATARLGVAPDGGVTLHVGTSDAGIAATMREVARQSLGVDGLVIAVTQGDTDRAGPAGAEGVHGAAFPLGRAVRQAALALKAELQALAGGDGALAGSGGKLACASGGKLRRLDLARRAPDAFGDVLAGSAAFELQTAGPHANGTGTPYSVYSFSAAVAEIRRAGKRIALDRIAVAVDVGRVLDRREVERRVRDAARAAAHAVLGSSAPAPRRIEVFLIEDPEPQGAFGLKSLGEESGYAVMAAIANAVRDATGKRPTRFPIEP